MFLQGISTPFRATVSILGGNIFILCFLKWKWVDHVFPEVLLIPQIKYLSRKCAQH